MHMRRVHGSFQVGFCIVVVTFYSSIVEYAIVCSEDKLNKKFVVAENSAELVFKGIKAIQFISFIS